MKFGVEPEEDAKRRTQSSPFKPFGAQSQRKDKKGVSFDLKEQQQVLSDCAICVKLLQGLSSILCFFVLLNLVIITRASNGGAISCIDVCVFALLCDGI